MKGIATVLSLFLCSAIFADVEAIRTPGGVSDSFVKESPFFARVAGDVSDTNSDLIHVQSSVRFGRLTEELNHDISTSDFGALVAGLPVFFYQERQATRVWIIDKHEFTTVEERAQTLESLDEMQLQAEGIRPVGDFRTKDGKAVTVLFDFGSMDFGAQDDVMSIFDRLTGNGIGKSGMNLNDSEMQPGDRDRLAEIFRFSPSAYQAARMEGNPINLRLEYEFNLSTPSGSKTWTYEPARPLMERTDFEVVKGTKVNDLVKQQLQNSDFGAYLSDRSGLSEFEQLQCKAQAFQVVVEYLEKAASARQASYLSLVNRLNQASLNYSRERFQGTVVDWPKDFAQDYIRSLGDIPGDEKVDIAQGTTISGVTSYLCLSVYFNVDGKGNHFTIRIPYSQP